MPQNNITSSPDTRADISRKQLIIIADILNKYQGGERLAIIAHFADQLAQHNGHFKIDRFLRAAIGKTTRGDNKS